MVLLRVHLVRQGISRVEKNSAKGHIILFLEVKSEDDYYNRKERFNLLSLESIEGRCAIFVRNVLVNTDVFYTLFFIQIS